MLDLHFEDLTEVINLTTTKSPFFNSRSLVKPLLLRTFYTKIYQIHLLTSPFCFFPVTYMWQIKNCRTIKKKLEHVDKHISMLVIIGQEQQKLYTNTLMTLYIVTRKIFITIKCFEEIAEKIKETYILIQ
jgi:hypothetical protein